MQRLSCCNDGLYLSRLGCSGDIALKQSYLLFRLITAMSLSLGVIWLKSILVMGLPEIKFLAASGVSTVLVFGLTWLGRPIGRAVCDSRSNLMDKLIQSKSSLLGVAHEG